MFLQDGSLKNISFNFDDLDLELYLKYDAIKFIIYILLLELFLFFHPIVKI